jgi:hypothetical protein
MPFCTTAQPLGFYCSGELFDQLTDRYGCYFEIMERHWKLIFRASLTAYLAFESIYDHSSNSISCAQASIASAGGDDFNIWEENPELADYIQAACDLSSDDIESLIFALTAQLRGK